MAVGHGYDIHRLVPGRKLFLGGVEVPHSLGLEGHSDGDVVLHALIDALLGAAGLGDIGQRFPDTDPSLKGISSEVMLCRVMDEIRRGWTVVNADLTVVAEEPKIAPHRAAIARRISASLGGAAVSIKAKTAEGLGPVGERKAIECHAVVQLQPKAG